MAFGLRLTKPRNVQGQRQDFAISPEGFLAPGKRFSLQRATCRHQIVNCKKRLLTGGAEVLQSRPFVPKATRGAAELSKKHRRNGAHPAPFEKPPREYMRCPCSRGRCPRPRDAECSEVFKIALGVWTGRDQRSRLQHRTIVAAGKASHPFHLC